MRLHRLRLHGYKRFLHPVSLLVSPKITALTGLNEAGKSSVLSALAQLMTMGWLPDDLNQRRTGRQPVLQADYVLSEDERQEYDGLCLVEPPTTLQVTKAVDGKVTYALSPTPRYSRAARDQAIQHLTALLNPKKHEGGTLLLVLKAAGMLPFYGLLEELKADAPLSEAGEKLLNQLADGGAAAYVFASPEPDVLAAMKEDFGEFRFVLAAQEEELSAAVHSVVKFQWPHIAFFDPSLQALPRQIELNDQTPEQNDALHKFVALMSWGGADGLSLRRLVQKGETRKASSVLSGAERGINSRLKQAWPTSAVEVRFRLEGTLLTLDLVESATAEHQDISLRSQGLQHFLALVAFVQRHHRHDHGVVLLMDEPDTHLHVDAQRLVIQALERLPGGIQVVYTTHSPFALPADLSAVREVKADLAIGTSTIENHVWHNASTGLMGLYVRMGAASATATAARAVLVVEGETDFVVLPKMLAEVLGEPLDVLCLPGYAHAKKTPLAYEEAALRVAYLFDGDEPGQAYRRQLLARGIPEARVHTLAEGTELEDYLDADLYCQAVQAALTIWGQAPLPITAAQLPGPDRHGQVEHLAQAAGREAPTKQAIMAQVLERWPELERHLDEVRRAAFLGIAQALKAALEPQPKRSQRKRE